MPDYKMHTESGNRAVAELVDMAIKCEMTWPEVYDWLELMSHRPITAEALDTPVREAVYLACKFEGEFNFE